MNKDLCKRCFQPLDQPALASAGLLVLRILAGVAFMAHGWGKIQSPMSWMGEEATVPGIFQLLAAVAEFGGGMAWILGLLMPLASFGLLCTMTVAAYTHMIIRQDPFVGGYELALVYWSIAVVFLTVGPGRFSIDAKFFGIRR